MTDQLKLHVDGSVAGTPAGVHVYPIDGGFVVADCAGWLPGRFSTVREAVDAAQAGMTPHHTPPA